MGLVVEYKVWLRGNMSRLQKAASLGLSVKRDPGGVSEWTTTSPAPLLFLS